MATLEEFNGQENGTSYQLQGTVFCLNGTPSWTPISVPKQKLFIDKKV